MWIGIERGRILNAAGGLAGEKSAVGDAYTLGDGFALEPVVEMMPTVGGLIVILAQVVKGGDNVFKAGKCSLLALVSGKIEGRRIEGDGWGENKGGGDRLVVDGGRGIGGTGNNLRRISSTTSEDESAEKK